MEDLYSILEVSREASADEIKKAYRNLAFKYHPDRNAGDKNAEEKFKQINEAYSVLGDETKRRQYDMYGSSDNSWRTQNQSQNYGNGTYGRYSNGTYGSYNSNYGNSSDPFWEFFNSDSYANETEHNTYTWTTRSTQRMTRQDGLRMLGRNVIQTILAFGAFRFIFFLFPLNIICLVAGFSGIVNSLRSLKYIFQIEKK